VQVKLSFIGRGVVESSYTMGFESVRHISLHEMLALDGMNE